MSEPNRRPCKACGCPIAVATQADGKKIPLDLRAPVYRLDADLTGEVVATRDTGAFVSHFSTCPKADAFSSKGKGATR